MSEKVGEVAKRTGISIRTLHHYDDIGLVSPSQHTEAGHRIYSHEDVQRLQQVLVLRSFGFSLEKIREFMNVSSAQTYLGAIDEQIAHMKEEIETRSRALFCLEKIASQLRTNDYASTDDILNLMEAMEMIGKYYSPEQLARIKDKADQLGADGMKQAQDAWKELIEAVRIEIDRGTPPEDECVQDLARQWLDMIQQFTGGDAGIEKSMHTMYRHEGSSKASQGSLDEETMAYMGKALAYLKKE